MLSPIFVSVLKDMCGQWSNNYGNQPFKMLPPALRFLDLGKKDRRFLNLVLKTIPGTEYFSGFSCRHGINSKIQNRLIIVGRKNLHTAHVPQPGAAAWRVLHFGLPVYFPWFLVSLYFM